MLIPKEIVPYLIEAIETVLAEELAAYNDGESDESTDDHYDPNDLVIFESFVLPVLRGYAGRDMDSTEMIDKGWRFTVGLIPWILNTRRAGMPPAHFGMLAKLFLTFQTYRVIERLNFTEEQWYEDNLPYIYRELQTAMLIKTKDDPELKNKSQ